MNLTGPNHKRARRFKNMILCDLHFADMALMESADFMQQLRAFKPQSLGCAVARRKSSTTLIFPLPPQACSGMYCISQVDIWNQAHSDGPIEMCYVIIKGCYKYLLTLQTSFVIAILTKLSLLRAIGLNARELFQIREVHGQMRKGTCMKLMKALQILQMCPWPAVPTTVNQHVFPRTSRGAVPNSVFQGKRVCLQMEWWGSRNK